MLRLLVIKQGLPKHPVSPKGVLSILRVRSNQLLFKEYMLVNYKKKTQYKKNFFGGYSINMSNKQQNIMEQTKLSILIKK